MAPVQSSEALSIGDSNMKRFVLGIAVGIVAVAHAVRLATAAGKSTDPVRLVGLALLALVFPPAAPANTHEPSSGSQLFVVASNSDSVAVIDTVTNQVSARI